MKAYRRRFVLFNLLLIGLVLTAVVAGVAVYSYQQDRAALRSTMEQVVRPLDSVSPEALSPAPSDDRPDAPAHDAAPGDKRQPARSDSAARRNITTVFYTPAEDSISVLSHDSTWTADQLEDILAAVADQEEDFGTLRDFGVIYYRTGSGSPYKIALTATAYLTRQLWDLGLTLALVWLAAMLCFLGVSVHLSALAVRPMEQAMAREKQFVADASHDLKTPLAVILTSTAILQENPEAAVGSQSKWLDNTRQAAEQMQGLIETMLTLSEAEGAKPAPKTPVDLSELVTKTALQLESVVYEKQVTLETDLADHLTVLGAEDTLQRIAAGLIENAAKYEPPGGRIWVTLSAEKRRARLSVRNEGTVIPPEDLPHVFDRFYRSDKSRRSPAEGHGLGLAITRQLVENLGGHIAAASSPDRGTEFTVTLPLA